MPSTTLKIAVLAPMPMPRVRTVSAVKSGVRSSRLRMCLKPIYRNTETVAEGSVRVGLHSSGHGINHGRGLDRLHRVLVPAGLRMGGRPTVPAHDHCLPCPLVDGAIRTALPPCRWLLHFVCRDSGYRARLHHFQGGC